MQWEVDASGNRSVTIRSKERALQAAFAVAWLIGAFLIMSTSGRASASSFRAGDLLGVALAVMPAVWIAWKIFTREVITIRMSEIEVARMLWRFQLGETKKLLIRDLHDVSLDESRFKAKNRSYVARHLVFRANQADLKLVTDVSEAEGHEVVSALRNALHLPQ